MGCRNSSMHGNPMHSRAALPVTASKLANIPGSELDVMRAVVQSTCITCELKHRPEVFEFLKYDLPLFHNVTLEEGNKQPTTLLLLNKNDMIINSVVLWDKPRDECNQILEHLGFYKKPNPSATVPSEFQNGPYHQLQEEDE